MFSSLRAQLQAKEKELLQLQRTNPSLLPPDAEQIGTLIDAVRALQLSTQDGSFVFASDCDYEDVSSFSPSPIYSTGLESIKNLPASVWLSPTSSTKQQDRQQPSIFDHIFALPIKTFLASSWPSTFQTSAKLHTKTTHPASIASHLLFMPLNAFKSPPATTTSASVEMKSAKNPYVNSRIIFNMYIQCFILFLDQAILPRHHQKQHRVFSARK